LVTVIAAAIALSLGRPFFVPFALGLILAAVLWPVVAGLRRVRMPVPVGAACAVMGTIIVLVLAAGLLEPPVRALAGQLPKTLMTARRRLESLGVRLPGSDARPDSASVPAKTAAERPSPDSTARATPKSGAAPGSGGSTQNGSAESPGSGGIGQSVARAFGITASALFALVEILLLAFFFLAAGDAWKDKLRRASRSPEDRERRIEVALEIRSVVLRYLLMNVIINAAQGALIAIVVWVLGYPSPILWGVITFVAEFVPYFGGATMVALLFLTGLALGRGVGHALLAPAAYLVVTTLQNNLVSPAAYGRGLRLNPAAILVGVMFWGVVWGIAGVFLAVPLLAAIRIIAEKEDSLSPVAVFLAD
jgi:predicted PurR-regulated permease PerM